MLAIIWLLIDIIQACELHQNQVICVNNLENVMDFTGNITSLEFRDIDAEELDLDFLLGVFPDVTNVTIYGGHLRGVRAPAILNKIEFLGLVRVGVENINDRFLSNFPNLKILDLRGNYLQRLNFSIANLKKLYLTENRWSCSSDLDWLFELEEIIEDINNLTCWGNPHPNKNLLTIANFLKDLKNECPDYCSCTLPKVVLQKMGSEHLEPVIEVNCSFRGLTELPLDLPVKTRILHLEGNEIRDLQPLKEHQIYKRILDLYLDHNKIERIDELEGSYFMRHFRVFSLTRNQLTEIPNYALDNALEQNMHMPNALTLYLGGNPWRCDCIFTPVFQEILQKFAPQIKDLKDIRCSFVKDDTNSLIPIIELSRSSVCRTPIEHSIQPLDLLNGVLASLILFILGKLAYDYYNFKRTGRLPWIVRKMP